MPTIARTTIKRDVIICTYFNQEGDRIVNKGYVKIPKFDMSKINPINVKKSSFKIPKEKREQYYEVLSTPEGRELLNTLKNEKTDEIINKYLHIERVTIKKNIGENVRHKSNLLTMIEEMLEEKLECHNLLPQKKIDLSKEEIYNMLVTKGLIK